MAPSRRLVVTVEPVDGARSPPIPTRATTLAAGFDLHAAATVRLRPGVVTLVPTGWKMRAPVGYFVEVRPRSGLASRGVLLANGPGTIDRDYAGEVKVPLTFLGRGSYLIHAGDRIAQVRLAADTPVTFRTGLVAALPGRRGGFGSTGR
ncbi:MAG: dUTP diphosphatase [Thermoplasmata archaeon]|nr:dUTP diphosphatase [Thermoplasmata archaeon]MCI4344621.1 dUTP diphosphatase [Thermoplasmata archaeon]